MFDDGVDVFLIRVLWVVLVIVLSVWSFFAVRDCMSTSPASSFVGRMVDCGL